MIAPLVVFVYNRSEHLKNTIQHLEQNTMASQTKLYCYSDGGKNEADWEKVKQVRDYLHAYQSESRFSSVEIIESSENKGLATSVIEGVTSVIQEFGKVIVVEDDLLTTKDFLEYMNGALDYYEDNHAIWSISGYTPPLDCLEQYENDVYLGYRGCSCGWGTWLNRWELTDWEVKQYEAFFRNRRERAKFNRGGPDLSNMLKRQMQGEIDSWAIRWCYSQYKQEMYTIYPRHSKVCNIGADGSGTHNNVGIQMKDDKTNSNKVSQLTIQLQEEEVVFCEVVIEQKIAQEFWEIFHIPFRNHVKAFLRLK